MWKNNVFNDFYLNQKITQEKKNETFLLLNNKMEKICGRQNLLIFTHLFIYVLMQNGRTFRKI